MFDNFATFGVPYWSVAILAQGGNCFGGRPTALGLRIRTWPGQPFKPAGLFVHVFWSAFLGDLLATPRFGARFPAG